MEKYLVAYIDGYDCEDIERVSVVDDEKEVLSLLSDIMTDNNHELISILKYNFKNNSHKRLKPTVNQKLKLILEEIEL